MSKRIYMTVTILILMGLIVGTVLATNDAYPVKMVELGETIPHNGAYNLDPTNIVPADAFLICRLTYETDPKIVDSPQYMINCEGIDKDQEYIGVWFDSHEPAPVGEYYSVNNQSSYLVDYTGYYGPTKKIDVDRIRSSPQTFRDENIRLYTVLPDPVQISTTPIPIGTLIEVVPTTEQSINYQTNISELEAKVVEHEVQIVEIKETLALTTTSPPVPTIQLPEPTITPLPTPTIDYDARIEALNKRIAEDEERAQKQDDLIYQILKFLGLKK